MAYLFCPHPITGANNLPRQLSEPAASPKGVIGNACGINSTFIKKKECGHITFSFFCVTEIWRARERERERESANAGAQEMVYLTLSYVISRDKYIVL